MYRQNLKKKFLAFFKHITNTIIFAESEINILVLKTASYVYIDKLCVHCDAMR